MNCRRKFPDVELERLQRSRFIAFYSVRTKHPIGESLFSNFNRYSNLFHCHGLKPFTLGQTPIFYKSPSLWECECQKALASPIRPFPLSGKKKNHPEGNLN